MIFGQRLSKTPADGPHQPSNFWWSGLVAQLSHRRYLGLSLLWHAKEQRIKLDDWIVLVWGRAEVPVGTARVLASRISEELCELGCPLQVSITDGFVCLV